MAEHGQEPQQAWAQAGTVLGDKYRVERPLGAGGMGAVLLVRHVRLGELRALKLMRPDLANHPPSRERFLREARAAARLKSEHVARVHDVGELPGGAPYIEMEYLEGEDLAAVLQRLGPQPASYVVGWMLEACEALIEAHDAGIVHRDLKPANLFLARGAGDRVLLKVLDFGIARLHAGEDHRITAAHVAVGSPLYMAPEQLRGTAHTDARSDLWSLGVTMFELLTAAPPFRAETSEALAVEIATRPHPPLLSLRPELPPALGAVVDRCLAKVPDLRFSSARELASALAALGSPRGLHATPLPYPHGSTDPAPSTLDPHASGALADTIQAPSGQRSGGLSSPGFSLTSPPLPAAPPSRRRKLIALAAILGALGLVAGGGAVALRGGYLARLGFAGKPTVGLAAIEALRMPRGSEGQLVNSEPYWQAAMNDFAAAARPGAPARYAAGEKLANGYLALLRGNTGNAERYLRSAAEQDPGWSVPHFCLALTHSRQKEMRKAIAAAQLAERLEPDWFGGAWAAARVHARLGTVENAIQEYRRAITKAPDNAVLIAELALVYHAARNDSEADRHGQKALALDPDLPGVHVMYAERALERGDGEAALRSASRALSVNPTNPPAKLAEAEALVMLGRDAEARASFEKAIAFWKQESPGDTAERFVNAERALKAGQLPRRTKPAITRPTAPSAAPTPTTTTPPLPSKTLPDRTPISPGGNGPSKQGCPPFCGGGL